jgi:hypothetical protein|tara:strand:+ start:447 stop:767 length:321 start_codon:yes stop_codon:yes gene_type:complete
MSKFDKSGLEATFEKLIRGKFGVLYDWKKPTIEKTVGPYLPDNFESFNELLKHILTMCEGVLRGAYPENLETLTANRKHEESVFLGYRQVIASKQNRGHRSVLPCL